MRKFPWLVACLLIPATTHADFYLGLGIGAFHTRGPAFQLAAEIHPNVEVNYSAWENGGRDRAAAVGYRFDNGSPVSVVLGIAHVQRVTSNLLRHTNAYVELRLGPFDHFSCQIAHYSSIGDDKGENLLLCGLQWTWSTARER